VAVVLAWLTYRFVERPVRLRARNGTTRTAVLAACLALLGGAGYATYLEDGMGFRRSAIAKDFEGDVGHDDYFKYLAAHYYACVPASLATEAPRWKGFVRCMQSQASPDVDIAIIGDSHAEHLFLGIAEALPDRNVAFYIKAAPAFPGQAEFQNVFEHVIASSSIRYVILTLFWEARLPEIPPGSSLEDKISAAIDALTRAGKTVYLTDDVPYFRFTGNDCKRFRRLGWKNANCETSAEAVRRRYERYVTALRKATEGRPDARLLETMKYLCDAAVCSMTRNNELLYRDQQHLNLNGSRFVGRRIAEDNPGIFN
jgi:hypothetical protein